ncbi:MAG: hypothetical protein ACPG4U_17280, partial [Pseudomonadales bacterium]
QLRTVRFFLATLSHNKSDCSFELGAARHRVLRDLIGPLNLAAADSGHYDTNRKLQNCPSRDS